MPENRYDRILSKINNRSENIRARFDKEFKGANPFGQKKMNDMDIVQTYLQTSDETKQLWRQIDPLGMAQFEGKVTKIMEGMKHA